MTGDTQAPERCLDRQGLTLPDPPAARVRALCPIRLADGQAAARICALNVLAQLNAAAGSLSAIARLVKIAVFVASTPDFTSQPQVADGVSRLFLDVLGGAGAHARSAIGVAALPLLTPVEVEAIAEPGS